MEEEVRDILELTKTKMREAGEFSREAYRDFIEESIEYYLEKGRLSDEDDLDSMKEELMAMYEEVETEETENEKLGLGLDDEEDEESDDEDEDGDEDDEEEDDDEDDDE
jgi:hypothetical protein